MNKKKIIKLWRFCVHNYFILIFLGCIGFVGLISFYKLFVAKPNYVYVKVKMGQGLWWASTQKPSLWFVKAIQEAKEEKDLTGKPIVKVLKVTYYPWSVSGQYDVFVTARLKVSKVGKGGKYNFKRSTIGVGSPVDFEFNSVQYSGTIIRLSENPPVETYVKKTIYLTKRYSNPWEYDALVVGDAFNNGERNVFIIEDKSFSESNEILLNEGRFINPSLVEERRYLTVKAAVWGRLENNQFIFAEEYVLSPGKTLNLSTPGFSFSDFVVAKME